MCLQSPCCALCPVDTPAALRRMETSESQLDPCAVLVFLTSITLDVSFWWPPADEWVHLACVMWLDDAVIGDDVVRGCLTVATVINPFTAIPITFTAPQAMKDLYCCSASGKKISVSGYLSTRGKVCLGCFCAHEALDILKAISCRYLCADTLLGLQ